MSQARCGLESFSSAAVAPLHRSDGPDKSGNNARLSIGGSSRLAAVTAAAACLAISTVSSASAFVVSPLHESAPRRIASIGRRVGKPLRDDAPLTSPSFAEDGFHTASNCRAPTSLIMAITDPETLLREQFAAPKRDGLPKRGSRGPPSSSSAYSSRVLQPGSSIYFVPERLSELKIDLEPPSSRVVQRTIERRNGSPASSERKKYSRAKANNSSSVADDVASGTVAFAVPQAKQIIESELEVVEAAPTQPAVVPETARTFKPISSTPTKKKQSATERRNRRAPKTVKGISDDDSSSGQRSSSPPTESVLPKRRMAAPQNLRTTPGRRSSTMPGFSGRNKTSGRRRAFRDGVRIAEERSGKNIKKILNSESQKKERRKANSEAMYKSSASVPDSLIAYTNEIHEKTERITPTEEIELGTKTQEAIRLQNLYENLEIELNREPTDAEWCAAAGKINMEALQTAIKDGMDAKNRLVQANLRMVQGVVNLYIRNGLGSQYNAGDLMQEGTMALIRAAEKFEPDRGFRFSTYAMYWIRSAVKRSQILQSRVIQVPQRLHETHKRVLKVEKELKAELGRKPTKEELALAANLSQVQLERCILAMDQECYSLDATIKNSRRIGSGADRKETMYEIVTDKVEDEGYQKMQQKLMKDSLINSLRRVLTPHEVDLILLRYGLMDERTLPHGFAGPLTIAEVSRLVGLKPDKVRRMINKCLTKLRSLIAHEWEDYENEIL